ncbi:adenylate/guanylate cyclase domain-containing protein [Streptomyces microflavus]|uniref:adenylate/guanylate cyclase domain-containing protein n=1 Tax=Streptomyces microflavus TaxID=1919 RepID=UPI0033CC3F35
MSDMLNRDQFANDVLSRYRKLTSASGLLEKSARSDAFAHAASMPSTGHPHFMHLGLGESGHCYGVSVFIDLVAFTSRTFWEEPEKVLRLNTAVMSQVAEVVQSCGGYILGLRGDGVFACFGDRNVRDPKVSAAFSMAACAFALDAVRNALNQLLEQSGMRPVQIRAGADYGRLDFVRIGSHEASEVNVVGFSANFAAKCEKFAHSWEVVIGEGLADLLPGDHYDRHKDSPKTYQQSYLTRHYHYHQVKWATYLQHLGGLREGLSGGSVGSIIY